MRVYTLICGSMLTGEIYRTESYEYNGPVAECKKGRERQEKIAEDAMQRAKRNEALQNSLQAETDPFRKSLIATKPGEMSPYARAGYDSKLRSIADTYDNVRRMGLRSLAYKGGVRPVGMEGSMMNTALENQGREETEAYSQGLQDTLAQGLEGVNIANQQQQIRDPERPANTSSEANYLRSKMGSGWTDVGGALKGAAEIGTNLATMGASGGIKGMFKKAWGGA